MGSRLGRRVIYFANLPIKLQMPKSQSNIREISLKTIPSATKVEIKRVLESLYGFDVAEVRTLNMDGKKKKRGGLLLARPDYKKAYVTLRHPLSLSADLFPVKLVDEARERVAPKPKPGVVAASAAREEEKRHWLHGRGDRKVETGERRERGRGGDGGGARFPWSSMRSFGSR